tara:strand:+ start:1738 stop:2496 length:759 start_codon:yes stop_codon:yes gene_type:complete
MKLAFVGGSSSGIGFAIAKMLLRNNYSVFITSKNKEKLLLAKEKLNSDKVYSKEADFSDLNSVKNLIKEVKKIGDPSIIILNTGGPPPSKLLDIDENMFNKYHNQTYLSHILIIKNFIENMKIKKWGRIVNVSSKLVKEPNNNLVLSSSYRAALINSLKCLSKDIGEYNITVNSIYTGSVNTERFENLLKKKVKENLKFEDILLQTKNKTPCKFIASSEDYSNLVEFLISDKTNYITGCGINFDGGASSASF